MSVITTVTVCLLLLLHINGSLETPTEDSPPIPVICDKIICKPPPADQDCRPHGERSEKIDAKLGPYKDCCPVFFCHGIGDGILYIGLSMKKSSTTTTMRTTVPPDKDDTKDDEEETNLEETTPLPVSPLLSSTLLPTIMGRSMGGEDGTENIAKTSQPQPESAALVTDQETATVGSQSSATETRTRMEDSSSLSTPLPTMMGRSMGDEHANQNFENKQSQQESASPVIDQETTNVASQSSTIATPTGKEASSSLSTHLSTMMGRSMGAEHENVEKTQPESSALVTDQETATVVSHSSTIATPTGMEDLSSLSTPTIIGRSMGGEHENENVEKTQPESSALVTDQETATVGSQSSTIETPTGMEDFSSLSTLLPMIMGRSMWNEHENENFENKQSQPESSVLVTNQETATVGSQSSIIETPNGMEASSSRSTPLPKMNGRSMGVEHENESFEKTQQVTDQDTATVVSHSSTIATPTGKEALSSLSKMGMSSGGDNADGGVAQAGTPTVPVNNKEATTASAYKSPVPMVMMGRSLDGDYRNTKVEQVEENSAGPETDIQAESASPSPLRSTNSSLFLESHLLSSPSTSETSSDEMLESNLNDIDDNRNSEALRTSTAAPDMISRKPSMQPSSGPITEKSSIVKDDVAERVSPSSFKIIGRTLGAGDDDANIDEPETLLKPDSLDSEMTTPSTTTIGGQKTTAPLERMMGRSLDNGVGNTSELSNAGEGQQKTEQNDHRSPLHLDGENFKPTTTEKHYNIGNKDKKKTKQNCSDEDGSQSAEEPEKTSLSMRMMGRTLDGDGDNGNDSVPPAEEETSTTAKEPPIVTEDGLQSAEENKKTPPFMKMMGRTLDGDGDNNDSILPTEEETSTTAKEPPTLPEDDAQSAEENKKTPPFMKMMGRTLDGDGDNNDSILPTEEETSTTAKEPPTLPEDGLQSAEENKKTPPFMKMMGRTLEGNGDNNDSILPTEEETSTTAKEPRTLPEDGLQSAEQNKKTSVSMKMMGRTLNGDGDINDSVPPAEEETSTKEPPTLPEEEEPTTTSETVSLPEEITTIKEDMSIIQSSSTTTMTSETVSLPEQITTTMDSISITQSSSTRTTLISDKIITKVVNYTKGPLAVPMLMPQPQIKFITSLNKRGQKVTTLMIKNGTLPPQQFRVVPLSSLLMQRHKNKLKPETIIESTTPKVKPLYSYLLNIIQNRPVRVSSRTIKSMSKQTRQRCTYIAKRKDGKIVCFVVKS